MRASGRWTIILVPHSSGPSRAWNVSSRMGFGLLIWAGVILFTLGGLGLTAVARGRSVSHYLGLQETNRRLIEQVQQVRQALVVMSDSLDTLSERGQVLRLVAGLNLLDPGVREAGIGGPPGAWPERDSLLALGGEGADAFAARTRLDALTRQADLMVRSAEEARESIASHATRLAATPAIMPVHGPVSSPFAAERFDPVVHVVRPHEGIDLAAPAGTPIAAPAAGVVVGVQWEEGYGNYVTVDHGYGVVTRYAHCSRILVVRGQHVQRGQKIALVGSTGEATGPHLHYEVWINGHAVDPKGFMLPENVITD